MQNNKMRILLIGDVVGCPGCAMFQKHIKHITEKYDIDGVIVNGENSAPDGRGITSKIAYFFKHNGANVITTGNHIWAKKEVYQYLNENKDLLRPANFPSECPGTGVTTFNIGKYVVGVINLQARIFMREQVACPFKTADTLLTYLKTKTNIIFVDFHGETTAEKIGLAYYLDGRVTGVVGTHTHVQTADQRILPKGTAFITDLGMTGPLDSMIGMKKEPIIQNLITQMPVKFEVETTGPMILSGVYVELDVTLGKALNIERIYIIDHDIKLNQ